PDEARRVLQAGLQRPSGPHGLARPDLGGRRMKELRVTPINNGTVIDHIPAGRALKVLKILGIGDSVTSTVTVAMHVPSRAMGWKDIVKVEDRELESREIEKIALIAPAATVNVIRNYNVAEKRRVTLPDRAVGILRARTRTASRTSESQSRPSSWSARRTRSASCANIVTASWKKSSPTSSDAGSTGG